MSRQGHERAHGPYQHGNRWRVVIVGANGARCFATSPDGSSSFASHAEALAFIEAFRSAADCRTVGEAVRDYVADYAANGARESSKVTARFRLVAFFRLAEADRPMRTLTPKLAQQLYAKRLQDGVSADTHRGELAYASRFADWCVKCGWLASNPFVMIEPRGERSRGKPQLRVDEARKLLNTVNADASAEATGVLMALLMGLRAHEIVERTARDLDDGGRLLWIPKSKTRAGVRQIAVPAMLQPRLRELAAGKRPDERIFGDMTRHALHYHVVRFAELAGVPRVTPHGLRGTFTTLAVTAGLPGMAANGGMSVADTARMLGHADGGATMRRHYMAPGAEESAASARVNDFLGAGSGSDESSANDLN